MIHNVTTDTVQVDVVEPLTEGTECRTAVTIAALIYKETLWSPWKEVTFRWVGSLLEHNEQWMGGRYMTMIIYREEINMTIVSHALAQR
jgi:hypothetical protein